MSTNKANSSSPTFVQLDQNTKRRLDKQVSRFGMTKSTFIRMAIIKEIEKCEQTDQP